MSLLADLWTRNHNIMGGYYRALSALIVCFSEVKGRERKHIACMQDIVSIDFWLNSENAEKLVSAMPIKLNKLKIVENVAQESIALYNEIYSYFHSGMGKQVDMTFTCVKRIIC